VGASRKLQDIFSDAKVPRVCRERIPLVVSGGEVVWIPGYRIAEGWEVADPAADSIQLRLMRKE
jgi:tRNA(Ile)-lysidine synthase